MWASDYFCYYLEYYYYIIIYNINKPNKQQLQNIMNYQTSQHFYWVGSVQAILALKQQYSSAWIL